MDDIEQIERDLKNIWHTRTNPRPKYVLLGASFGVVCISKEGLTIEAIDEDGVSQDSRLLTTDELAQFKTEYPSLFKEA